MKYYFDLYNRAYSEIGALTPISADCGALCGAKCCHGDDEAGMIVFPGEEKLLSFHGFNVESRDMDGFPVFFTSCSGRCKRIFRPLSCRIFPLVPDFRDGVLKITDDPRARLICPLLLSDSVEDAFYQSVHRAFDVLIEDQSVREMLTHYTKMLDSYRSFW